MKALKIISTFLFVTAFVLYCTGCAAQGGETIATVVTEATQPPTTIGETLTPEETAKAVADVLGRPGFADFRVEDIHGATLDTSVKLDDRWTPGDTEAMWAAIQADCKAGTLDPMKTHPGTFSFADGSTSMWDEGPHDGDYLLFTLWGGSDENPDAYMFEVFSDSEHVLNVLESRGLLEEYGITVN